MLVNSGVTIYHKGFDKINKNEIWTRFNYQNAWFFGNKGAGVNKGYTDANDVNVRLSYKLNDQLNINNFAIGDIIIKGIIDDDISEQRDLKGHQTYNITSINNNNFGINQHIHIGGK